MNKLCIGGIVRNRDWILPTHLEAIRQAATKTQRPVELVYLINDSVDYTYQILLDYKKLPMRVIKLDLGEEGWTRDGKDGPRYNSGSMGYLRNLWARACWDEDQLADLLVVDSDVIVPEYIISQLSSIEADVVGAYVPIADQRTPIHMIGYANLAGYPYPIPSRTGDEKVARSPHVVSCVGGCYYIKNIVGHVKYKNLWGTHPIGEDGHFARKMLELGCTMMVNPECKCIHVMENRPDWREYYGVPDILRN